MLSMVGIDVVTGVEMYAISKNRNEEKLWVVYIWTVSLTQSMIQA